MLFSFDGSVARYRDTATGRLVAETAVRSALDQVLTVQMTATRALTQSLIDGTITLPIWTLQMMQAIKSSHLIGVALANGGWNNMSQADFGFAGQRIRSQYSFLRSFALDLATGRQPLNGVALRRAEMYDESARASHRAAVGRAAKQRGMEEEKSNLGSAEHCPGCVTQTSRGWQPIGTLVPCGSRQCLSRCHCVLSYRMRPAA